MDKLLMPGTRTQCPSGCIGAVLFAGERLYLVHLDSGTVALVPAATIQEAS